MCLRVMTPSIWLRELKKKKVAAGVFPEKAKRSRWVCD